jgi:predicted Abi (CAAX) family protease
MLGDFSEFQTSIYKSLINVSYIVFIIGMSTTGAVSLNCYTTGYTALAIAILLILVQLLNSIQTKKEGASSIGTIVLTLLPFLIMLSVISSQIYFNIIYKNIIIDGKVSSGFNIFSNIVIILLLIQTYIIYSVVSSKTFQEKGISNVTSGVLLLLAILSGIATNIIRTILKFFTTDGFTSNIIKI